ncbi:hypothetical protein [Nannocystis radixulma]|uniref:Myxococcus cysteine-rich repeat-containing protein n=1 Tax=Nannocystis radixulma TaxID=2995305 RepID=A0ABT5B2T5_9BACT|nr:hypothetical protein [Nannocystis radixulma]MDC0668043.1 hypothetical protein [Nannocystis radixulma]
MVLLSVACARRPFAGDEAGATESSHDSTGDLSATNHDTGGESPVTDAPAGTTVAVTTGDIDTDASAGGPGTSTAAATSEGAGTSTAATTSDDPGTSTAATTSDDPGDDGVKPLPGPFPGPMPDPLCGNGVLDPGEACDDGNLVHRDACLPNCTEGAGITLPPVWTQPPPSWAQHAAVLDGELFGAVGDALVVAGHPWDEPARLELVPLQPDGPAPWSFVAAESHRLCAMTIAGDGDIILAGVMIPPVPDASRPLWLARVALTGAVEWSTVYPPEPDEVVVDDIELAATPSGDIAVVRRAELRVFDAAGQLRWTHRASTDAAWSVEYDDLAVDPQGRIYVAGTREPGRAFATVEALDPAGQLLWRTDLASEQYGRTEGPALAVSAAGFLFVALGHDDGDSEVAGASLAALELDGALRWWHLIDHQECCIGYGPHRMVPAADGGVLVAWILGYDDSADAHVARYDVAGAHLYQLDAVQGWVLDLRAGPDNRWYSLEASKWEDDEGRFLVPHLP